MLALGLELPEETFVKLHDFDAQGETYGEFTVTRTKSLLMSDDFSTVHEVVRDQPLSHGVGPCRALC